MDEETISNPFALGELDRLFDARMTDDVEYLKDWSKKAVTYYEIEKARLYKLITNLSSNQTITEEE